MMSKLTAKARFALLPWIQHQDGCTNLNRCTCGLNQAMQQVDQMEDSDTTHYTYQFHLVWSEEDECYIVTVLEFRGVIAHGTDPISALREAEISLDTAIEVYEVCGWDIPKPKHK
jgi:predicted RNase H-like HicB family nuclease